jgi:hypothetical protein
VTQQFGRIGATSIYQVNDVMMDHSRPTYYFCCEQCGACGKHKNAYGHAAAEAETHMKEHRNGSNH